MNLTKIIIVIIYSAFTRYCAGQHLITNRIKYNVSEINTNNSVFKENFKFYNDSSILKNIQLYDIYYYYPSGSLTYPFEKKYINFSDYRNDFLSSLNEKTHGLNFIETWEIDTLKNTFIKQIESYSLSSERIDPETKEFRGYKIHPYIKNALHPSDIGFKKIAENITYDVRIATETEYLEGIESIDDNIFSYDRDIFISMVFKKIITSNIDVYDFTLNHKLKLNEVLKMLLITDTSTYLIPSEHVGFDTTHQHYNSVNELTSWDSISYLYKKNDSTYKQKVTYIIQFPSSITQIRFIEDWYWDEDLICMKKVVKAFCPILSYKNKSTRTYKPLFWIYPKGSEPE